MFSQHTCIHKVVKMYFYINIQYMFKDCSNKTTYLLAGEHSTQCKAECNQISKLVNKTSFTKSTTEASVPNSKHVTKNKIYLERL